MECLRSFSLTPSLKNEETEASDILSECQDELVSPDSRPNELDAYDWWTALQTEGRFRLAGKSGRARQTGGCGRGSW